MRSPGCTACSTTAKAPLLLQKATTNRAQAIKRDDVLACGAKGSRTPDLLHAIYLQHGRRRVFGHVRRPIEVAESRSGTLQAAVFLCCTVAIGKSPGDDRLLITLSACF